MTGGPLVAKGKVMVGTTGRAPGGNFIVALDAETGRKRGASTPSRSRASRAAIPGTVCRREAQRRLGLGAGQLRSVR